MPPKCSICGAAHRLLGGEYLMGPGCRCAEVELWSCREHDEQLYHDDIDEAIAEFLDEGTQADATLVVYGWKAQKLPESWPDWEYPLEHMLEQLDEEYGNPEEGTEPNEAMIEAAKALAAAIRDNYRVWTCEVVQQVTINISDWIAEHRPEWLDADPS